MPKVIVFSGHGDWKLGKDSYVQLPARSSIKFYTMNARTLSDALGGDLDRGVIQNLVPDQEAGPFKSIPDMRLYPPRGLNIKTPDPANWNVIKLPCRVPVDNKNIQVQIQNKYTGGASLKTLFKHLQPAIQHADSVVFLWAACRAINLGDAGGDQLGINEMQR